MLTFSSFHSARREWQKRERARQLELASAGQKQLRGRVQDKRARAKEQMLGEFVLMPHCGLGIRTVHHCVVQYFFPSFGGGLCLLRVLLQSWLCSWLCSFTHVRFALLHHRC
jgi:hypothetical protein